jgi:hypothetical protein
MGRVVQDGENGMTAGDWLCQKDSPRCDALLACGAVIVAELRETVLAETQFTCSAGIGHNKVLQTVDNLGCCSNLLYFYVVLNAIHTLSSQGYVLFFNLSDRNTWISKVVVFPFIGMTDVGQAYK